MTKEHPVEHLVQTLVGFAHARRQSGKEQPVRQDPLRLARLDELERLLQTGQDDGICVRDELGHLGGVGVRARVEPEEARDERVERLIASL